MSVDEELAKLSPKRGMVLTIGVFDGVHIGHKYLISRLKEHAERQNLLSGVVTFRQHPQEVLATQTELPYLTTLAERTRLIKNEGIDEIIVLPFDQELANLGARQFIGLLQKYLRMEILVVGPDFALGKNREGDISNLRALGQDTGFKVIVIPPIIINGEVVSSTAIRSALAQGDMKRAYKLTGRYFSIRGRVVAGVHRGVQLGFPTANLELDPEQGLPIDGVYAAWTLINNRAYQSMTNIGKRPTFGNNQRTVEVYILDYQGDLYGQELKINIVERLREEKRFDTAEELKKQMADDVEKGKAILNSGGKDQ
jgi:riboflavin kinase/FMN adenylyltransferase